MINFLFFSDTMQKRILIKLSWETFKNNSTENFDYDFMKILAQKVKKLSEEWNQIVIVSWGGNIFRWAINSKWAIDTATGHYMGMMATLMNWMAFGDILSKAGLETRILSAIEAPRVVSTFNRQKALRHLDNNRIVITTAWTWNPYCTNDLAAVIRAIELNCDLMIKATKVDWIYDKDPMKHTDAQKFNEISHQEAYRLWLNIMDHSAIATAMDNKLPIFVCKVENLEKFWKDDSVGSWLR